MKFYLITMIILMCFPHQALAQQESTSEISSSSKGELGFYNVYDQDDGSQSEVLYYEEDTRFKMGDDYTAWTLHLRFRVRYDFQDEKARDALSHRHLSRELLYASKVFESSSLKLGLQELNWGESLIFPIIDLINPRDVLYPKGFLDSDSKLSVPMINYELYSSSWGNLQLIYIPLSRVGELPEEIGDYAVEEQEELKPIEDQEFGLRYKLPLDSLDLKLYALHHRNREPSFRFKAFSDGSDLELATQKLTSFGLSSSVGTMTRVWKMDARHTPDQELSGIVRRKETRDLTQIMLGLDQALGVDHTFGFELHFDNWGLMPEAYNDSAFASEADVDGNLLWGGLNIRSNFFGQSLKPQLIHFQGINNNDRFSRFQIAGIIADSYQISVEYQESEVASSSPKFILNQAKRFLTELKIHF
ncbi:DUF1302 family protein [Pseudobacteriovorax antillogorgiicola]|uniref:Phosphate-selective porin O and P n=1 Tax=Pseudobacteriovorax antillogorgiicola TaxID=1513793 RepID=A0A1Y6BM56_9BACT|nr:DUF1302 family protein [Pseudobacteriovorax antillogorgiicola]TCS54567.1 hypothetical protein EDD56_10680 [Pseudobacteriovorax antillogorgiicola]SMF18198.1 hypothetical protein SAMN06296036_106163 [Pseudobacteriovorax antillogorgiicola]